MPTLDGYMNEGGFLNLPRFEKFLVCLSQFDRDHFGDEYADMKYLESKTYKEIMEDEMRDIRTVTEPEKFRRKLKKSKENGVNNSEFLTENANDELKALLAEQAKEFNSESKDCETAFTAFSSHNSFNAIELDADKEKKANMKKPDSAVETLAQVVDEDPNSESGK
uniref:Uncharacterized protein n=1 Tax=Romanomermis culicivorax TaxID=13658 RepID=A0A915JZC2_ROMCU